MAGYSAGLSVGLNFSKFSKTLKTGFVNALCLDHSDKARVYGGSIVYLLTKNNTSTSHKNQFPYQKGIMS